MLFYTYVIIIYKVPTVTHETNGIPPYLKTPENIELFYWTPYPSESSQIFYSNLTPKSKCLDLFFFCTVYYVEGRLLKPCLPAVKQ